MDLRFGTCTELAFVALVATQEIALLDASFDQLLQRHYVQQPSRLMLHLARLNAALIDKVAITARQCKTNRSNLPIDLQTIETSLPIDTELLNCRV